MCSSDLGLRYAPEYQGGLSNHLPMALGATAFVPTGVAKGWTLVACERGMTVLVATVPD